MGPKRAEKMPQYSSRKLRQALQALENGTPVRKAASQYQILRSTLRNKRIGFSPSETCGKRGYYSVLGKEIEEEIVKWIFDAADRGFPVTMVTVNPWGGDEKDASLIYIWRDIVFEVFEAYQPNLPPFFEEIEDTLVDNSDALNLDGQGTDSHKRGRNGNCTGMPSVITSQEWVNIHNNIESKKQEKDIAKAERKRKREEKAKANAIIQATKKSKKLR